MTFFCDKPVRTSKLLYNTVLHTEAYKLPEIDRPNFRAYNLLVDIIEGTNLFVKYNKLSIKIYWGNKRLSTNYMPLYQRDCIWNITVYMENIIQLSDIATLPDIFIYLHGGEKNVAGYIKLNPQSLFNYHEDKPFWVNLINDKKENGLILLRGLLCTPDNLCFQNYITQIPKNIEIDNSDLEILLHD